MNKKRLYRLGWVFLGVAGLLMTAIAVEHFRGGLALHRCLAELQGRGENLTVAAHQPVRPAPDQNAATSVLMLSNQIQVLKANLFELPSFSRLAAPGREVVAWQLDDWLQGKESNNWQIVGQALDRACPQSAGF